jgi:hypothetical protein
VESIPKLRLGEKTRKREKTRNTTFFRIQNMQGSVAISNIIEINRNSIPDKYQLRDGRMGLDICQDTFWNLLLALLVQGTKTPITLSVGYEKLTFYLEPQDWQLFLSELGLRNDQEIETFRHLLITLLRGDELQTTYTTLISNLPDHTLTLIAFIGQAALRYLQSQTTRFNESDYPYEEGKLTEYWYEHLHRFTTQSFEERVRFLQFCQWAYVRLNRPRLYRIFIFAFILPAKKAISIGIEQTLATDLEFEQAPRMNNNEHAWNDDPKEIARLLKNTEVANVPVKNDQRLPDSKSASLFRSRFKQVLATMNAEFEKRLTRELEEFESSYEMLRRELVTLRDQNTQKTQETAIKTLSELLDPILRSEQIVQIQSDVDKTDSMTRVFIDNIAVGSWSLEGKIGDIVSEKNKDRYLPDPEKMLSSQEDGQLTITRCGLKANDILLLPPYVMRKNP